MVTGVTSQAPAMNPAFQPKLNQANNAALGTNKPAANLGSKPNFLAKKRKFWLRWLIFIWQFVKKILASKLKIGRIINEAVEFNIRVRLYNLLLI